MNDTLRFVFFFFFFLCVWVYVCVCERAYQLYCLRNPPRIAELTAGYKGLFHNCKNKVHVVVVVVQTWGSTKTLERSKMRLKTPNTKEFYKIS